MSSLSLADFSVDADVKLRRVARKFRAVMDELGLDPADPHLEGTELRVARAYRELFAGLAAGAEPALRTFPNTERYRDMVSVTDIPFYSLCAHHFLPFFGSVHVAYLPGERIVGLSKLARVVEFYARRPQVQERLTEQIVEFLERRLRPKGVMAVVQARHFCIEMRGTNRAGLVTTTRAVRGTLADERRRREFLALLPRSARGLTLETESDA
ncbi:MAG TPA: GTP cyclohydrolase I FolE [Gemmatimonadales bacterium]|nr:GTP cyclohydrolase I FolE [Gemmatimonadales bacterium]